MASESVIEVPGTSEEAGNKINYEGMEIVTFDKLWAKYSDDQVRRIAQAGPQDPETQSIIVDLAKLSAAVYDNMSNLFSNEELKKFTQMVSQMSSKYKDNPELEQKIKDWCTSRKRMIKISNSAAKELDLNSVTVCFARIIGSSLEILISFKVLEELWSILTLHVSDISPPLGLMMEMALKFGPYLRYMGIVSCFLENLQSELILNRVVEAMKKDKEMFQPLKEWFDETDELEESVKKLLPYEIDKEDIKNIEAALKDFEEEQKIFAAAFLSNIKHNPDLYKDGKFLSKVFLFCRSDAAKEWYKRMLKGDRPASRETAMLYFNNELQQLIAINLDSKSTIEIGKFSIQTYTLPRLILLCMNGMSIYHCIKQIQTGSTKHRYSDVLRQLAINSQSFLNTMNKIHIRHQLKI